MPQNKKKFITAKCPMCEEIHKKSLAEDNRTFDYTGNAEYPRLFCGNCNHKAKHSRTGKRMKIIERRTFKKNFLHCSDLELELLARKKRKEYDPKWIYNHKTRRNVNVTIWAEAV